MRERAIWLLPQASNFTTLVLQQAILKALT
jgi:hypothetical protein